MTLAERMKENYENRTRYKLMRRCPVIIRLDGKSFSKYTKGLKKPFDQGLLEDMQQTAKFLCKNIMGAKCAYTQSDEITILITDFDRLETQAWFDNNLQKICSISASMATAYFNQLRTRRKALQEEKPTLRELYNIPLAFFDARVFQISEPEEVVNNFIWRQRDAVKNSISMLGQSLYSSTELHKKNSNQVQEMCFQKGINWNDLSCYKKRGTFVSKNLYLNGKKVVPYRKNQWATRLEDSIAETGDLWYQKESTDSMFPDERGRLLEYGLSKRGWEDFRDIPIEKIESKWEIVQDTPDFSKDRNVILQLMENG